MTNGLLLEQTIRDRGLKITHICKELNISHKTFRNKITRKCDFKATEIIQLTKLLNLTTDERDNIFLSDG